MPPRKTPTSPAADELNLLMTQKKTASFFLRAGFTISLLYASIASLLDPYAWVGFFPTWLRDLVPDNTLIITHGILGIALALWLLSGKYVRWSAAIMAMWVLLIFALNIPQIDITFRDIAIFFAAIGLFSLHAFKK